MKIKISHLVLLIAIIFPCVVFAQKKQKNHTWTFTGIRESKGNYPSGAPFTLYQYTASFGKGGVGSSMGSQEMESILRFINLSDFNNLVGFQFKVPDAYVSVAVEWLAKSALVGGDYKPPSVESVVERAARALAEFKQPNYSDIVGRDLAQILQDAFYSKSLQSFPSPDRSRLESFKKLVSSYSGGKVSMVDVDGEDFALRVMGEASYFRLIHADGRKANVTFADGSNTAFSCDGCDRQEIQEVMSGQHCQRKLTDLNLGQNPIWRTAADSLASRPSK